MSSNDNRLLHVDDDPDMQEYVAALLDNVIKISHASSLSDARIFMQEHTYKVVLLDLTLPDGSGFNLIHDLSADHPDTAIIIFSSHDVVAPPGNIAAIFEKGHFSQDALVQTINKHCK